MIIVDDCSKDRTYKRALEIASKFPNIKVYRNDSNIKCGPTYRRLLDMAKGDYCGVLDGDDALIRTSISTIVKYYIKNPDIDFIWTKHRWFNSDMSKFRSGISNKPKCNTIYESESGFKHVYSHWRTFKTSLREKRQLFSKLPCTVDKDLGYTLEEVGSGAFLPIELYNYRYHKNNMSHNSSQKVVWGEVRKKHKHIKRNKIRVLKCP